MNFEMKNKNLTKAINQNEFCVDFLDQNTIKEIVREESTAERF